MKDPKNAQQNKNYQMDIDQVIVLVWGFYNTQLKTAIEKKLKSIGLKQILLARKEYILSFSGRSLLALSFFTPIPLSGVCSHASVFKTKVKYMIYMSLA